MIALVWGGTLNSSAANFRTAVNGAPSGTLNLFFFNPKVRGKIDESKYFLKRRRYNSE